MAYTDTNQIGEITEITGDAKIIRTDGTEETVTLGTEIYQGDVVETSGDSAVNIAFIDESSFAVSDDARVTIDEFVFDPITEGGSQDFSVDKGVFMYTSGLIGRENPDQVEIDTPVGSIGIRGTIIGGNINPDGESDVSVIEGAIVVRTNAGEQLLTNQYDTVSLTSIDAAPSDVRAMSVNDIANKFAAVKDVSSSLFSSFEDQIQQEQQSENVSEGLDSAEEAQAEAEANAGEEVGEAVQENAEEPVQEAIEDLAPETDTLDADPEIKSMDNGDTREMAQERRAMMSQENQSQSNSASSMATEPQIAPDIINRLADNNSGGLPDTITVQVDNGLAENANGSTTSILVATVALQSGNTNIIYELLDGMGNPNPDFRIENNGNIFFQGANSGDFENGDQYSFTIRALDSNTNQLLAEKSDVFNLNPVDEAAILSVGLEDDFDIASNVDGVIKLNDLNGVRIAKLNIDDPENEVFGLNSSNIIGNIGGISAQTLFDIVEDNGEFYLELKAGFQLTGTPGNYTIFDSIIAVTDPLGDSFAISLDIDGLSSPFQTINLTGGNVSNVISGTSAAVGVGDVVFGDDGDNTIILNNSNFKFINGGDGNDLINLDGLGTGQIDEFDLTSVESNSTAAINSADLTSIEEIRFLDTGGNDTLKINIEDIIRLIKTSDSDEIKIATDGIGNSIDFYEGSSQAIKGSDGAEVDLRNHGFTKINDDTVNGETFAVYEHSDGFGKILIETDINGANTGGL